MTQRDVYTVSQVNNYIASVFSENRVLSRICIKGEISNCKYHTSGHIYFTLKDGSSQISAVMWASNVSGLKIRLQDGMQALVSGQIKVYEKSGIYQLYAETAEPDGMGALYEMYERLKKKLAAEGIFDREHKKEIPEYCASVGVVTAKTGAAVRDIISISKRRNPYVQLILYPAQVQGSGAAASVIRGIKELEMHHPDVIIIGRGGGSIEDLWAFNDESLARTIYDCPIPVISAVGHETDFTIADYAADLRASTPSAAAELAVCDMEAIMSELVDLHSDLYTAMESNLTYFRQKTEHLKLKLKLVSPRARLDRKRNEAETASQRLSNAMQSKLKAAKHDLALKAGALEGLSPLKRLEAGYAYVTDLHGHNIKSTSELSLGDTLKIRVTDGEFKASVSEK